MLLYAEDAAESDTPWDRWRFRSHFDREPKWLNTNTHPCWYFKSEYERIPAVKTISINGIEVHEPVRSPLKYWQEYWTFDSDEIVRYSWSDNALDQERLANGVMHLTKEAAQIHLAALFSFTKS